MRLAHLCAGFRLERGLPFLTGPLPLVAFACVCLVAPARAQTTLSENFAGPTLVAGLELSSEGSYTIGGSATNTSGQGAYIRTSASDFNLVNFSLLVTYTVTDGSGSGGMAIMGLGSGIPDDNYYTEPLQSVYVRSFPNDFGDGNVQPSINSATGNVAELATFGEPGPGTHRLLLTKSGDVITFAVSNAASGTFTADYTATFSLAGDLPFLDATNSRLFVGSEGAGASFDSFVLTTSAVPEPAATAVLAGLVALLGAARRARRAQPA